MLSLYSDDNDAASRRLVEGVRDVRSSPIVRRLPIPGPVTYGRGLEIRLTCEERAFEGTGAFLFGSVMQHFFSRYVSLNSFTETVLHTLERERGGPVDGSIRHAPRSCSAARSDTRRTGFFDWFDALRRIECVYDDRPRLGRSIRPADDPVRLAHTPSRASPHSIDRVDTEGETPRVHSLMLGLWGSNGGLPLHLTEYVLERERTARDHTFTAFADVFHHRMLSFFYRAWADSQPPPCRWTVPPRTPSPASSAHCRASAFPH